MAFIKDLTSIIRRFEQIFGLSLKIFIVTATIVIMMGVYVANLIYGDNSLYRLQYLQQKRENLKEEIYSLKQENAKLHKQYLEWTDARR
jgi:cell division protein FtsB